NTLVTLCTKALLRRAFFLGFGGDDRGFSFSPSPLRHPRLRLWASGGQSRPGKGLSPALAGLSFTPRRPSFQRAAPRGTHRPDPKCFVRAERRTNRHPQPRSLGGRGFSIA